MQPSELKSLFMEKRLNFLFSFIVQADTVQDAVFKYHALKRILFSDPPKQGFSEEELIILTEELAYTLSVPKMMNLIRSSGILDKRGDRYIVKDTVFLANFQNGKKLKLPLELANISIPIEEIKNFLFRNTPLQLPWTVRTVRNAIFNGLGWLVRTLKTAGDPVMDLVGLPAFWLCEEDGDKPMGYLQAGTSNGNTLRALSENFAYLCSYVKCQGKEMRKVFDIGVRFVLNGQVTLEQPSHLQNEALVHCQGGFWAYDDQPESFYPSVDATWDAVIALCSYYEIYDQVQELYGAAAISKENLGRCLLDGIGFLLRIQLPDGAWGIFRYPGDKPVVHAYEFTTAYTIFALSLSLINSVYEDQNQPKLRHEVEASLYRAFEFLVSNALPLDGVMVWLPYFHPHAEGFSQSDILKSTAWTCTGLLALFRQFPHLQERVMPFLEDVVKFASRDWRLDYQRVARVEFRAPQKGKLSDTFTGWNNRLDTTLVSIILDLHNQAMGGNTLKICMTDELWDSVEGTINNILQEQHPEHGHWNEPIDRKPLAAATLTALQALQYYLRAVQFMV